MMLDPRLADGTLLRLAALRVRQRQTQPPPGFTVPDPGEAWWAEVWGLVKASPYGADIQTTIIFKVDMSTLKIMVEGVTGVIGVKFTVSYN